MSRKLSRRERASRINRRGSARVEPPPPVPEPARSAPEAEPAEDPPGVAWRTRPLPGRMRVAAMLLGLGAACEAFVSAPPPRRR